MERDDANLFVLEATMISLILLGAAYAVQSLGAPSVEEERPRVELGRLVDDAISVLAGLDNGNGTVLDLYVAEALHCAADDEPSLDDCDGRRGQNLSLKIESYLPLGAGYAVGLGNGGAVREIYRSPLPRGESVSSSQSFAPNWSLAFTYTELSCYDAGTDVHAAIIPISRAARSWTQKANLSADGAETVAVRADDALQWQVTLPSATRPASATLVATVTGNVSYPGSTTYGACALGGMTDSLREALAAAPFTASAPSVPITSSITFTADLAGIDALPGVSLREANVTLVEPVPPRADLPDSWIRADRLTLAGTSARTATWTPPSTALYGAHVAYLRAGIDVNGVELELRKALVVDVALPTGEIPFDPPYRATLQAWLPDWS